MIKVINLLKRRPHFCRVLFALFLSGIGTAFTSVAVYNEMAKQNWGAIGFAVAFCAGLLPGWLSSLISGKRCRYWPMGRVLLIGQLVAMSALVIPLLGVAIHHLELLLLAEVITSAVGGFLIPVYKTLERDSFNDEEIESLSALDSFILTANFIFGQGLAAILASHFSLFQFLIFTAFFYLSAVVVILPLTSKISAVVSVPNSPAESTSLSTLHPRQMIALWILPWLALVCAPLMVILPARGADFTHSESVIFNIAVEPALVLLCSRTLGQLLGPMVAVIINVKRLSESPLSLVVAVVGYIGLYSGAFNSSSLGIAAGFCLLAHLASNVVYSVGNYQLLRHFSAEEIGWAAGFVHRAVTLITAISGLVGGVLVTNLGWNLTLIFSAAVCLTGLLIVFPFFKKQGNSSCTSLN